jgi:chromosome segregation ATPase
MNKHARHRARIAAAHAEVVAERDQLREEVRDGRAQRQTLENRLARADRELRVARDSLAQQTSLTDQWRAMADRSLATSTARTDIRAAQAAVLSARESALQLEVQLEMERQRADDNAEDVEFHRDQVAELLRRESELVVQLDQAVSEHRGACSKARHGHRAWR